MSPQNTEGTMEVPEAFKSISGFTDVALNLLDLIYQKSLQSLAVCFAAFSLIFSIVIKNAFIV